MNKRILGIILIIVVIAVIFLFYFKQNTHTVTDPPAYLGDPSRPCLVQGDQAQNNACLNHNVGASCNFTGSGGTAFGYCISGPEQKCFCGIPI